AADLEYLDKSLDLIGVRQTAERTADGGYFVAVLVNGRDSGNGSFVPGRIVIAAPRPGIYCYFSRAQVAALARLDGKQPVTIRGTCKGTRADQKGVPRFVVVMEDCTIVPSATPGEDPGPQRPSPPPESTPDPPKELLEGLKAANPADRIKAIEA